jgi:hypothetical protein
MKKPHLCLSLSASALLVQSALLPVLAQDGEPIWQKLSGTANDTEKSRTPALKHLSHSQTTVKSQNSQNSPKALDLATSAKTAVKSLVAEAPAAMLTLHAPITETSRKDSSQQSKVSAPDVASIDESTTSDAKQLLAQLSPDHIVAQSVDTSDTTASPIPPVVTGTVDLEEFKRTNIIDLKTAQSRTFKLKNKIVRTSISDPSIAEPVVVSENQLVLLGKTPGTATLVLWDDAGNSVAIDLRVTRDYGQLQSTLREIDPRIIVKAFSVGGSDRVLLLGDVDHPETVIKAFSAANVFMDDRGMNIQVANSRLINARVGEQGGTSGGGAGVEVLWHS